MQLTLLAESQGCTTYRKIKGDVNTSEVCAIEGVFLWQLIEAGQGPNSSVGWPGKGAEDDTQSSTKPNEKW